MKMGSNIKEFRFHEGCLDHKWASSYRKLWLVMKRNIIYIFRDRPYIPENHEGTLTVDKTTKFEVRAEKPNNYKFILYTNNRGRINTFKSDKKSERDLWRGYIVGVARQKVPDDLDLPRDIINRIKQDVANFHLVNGSPEQFDVVSRTSIDNRSSTSNVSTISPQQSVSSGRSNPNRHSVMSGDSGVSVSVSQRSPSSGSGSMTIGGIGGGPFMRHKFTNSPEDSIAPSWFFEACTREKAESYLAIAAENKFGDTLMRESTKFKQDGSYVISKRIVRQGRSSVEHYEVIRVDRGYKIKVENQHDAMRNLTDVMNYFVRTSGSYGTTPLSTNRLSDFGMTEDPYNTGRIQLEDTVAAVLAEPVPDYEEPVQTKPQVLYQRHKTVTPNSHSATFNFHQARYSYNTERHAKNYIQQPGKPSIDEIQTNIKAAATLHMLDKTIDPFDEPAREEDYINLKDLMRQEDDVHVPSLPPPPVPHAPLPEPHPVLPLRNQSYVNKEPQLAFQAPVPPPAPAKLERPKSVPNFADHLKSVQLNPVLDKKAVTNKPPPVQHSLSQPDMKDNNRDGVPTPQQLGLKKTNFKKADPSKGEIMRPTGNPSLAKIKSLDIPSSHLSDVPSPQQMGLRLTKTKRESISEPDQQEVDKAPEIDQSNPGGVSSIKSIFERKPSESDDKQPRQQTGDGSLPVTYNPPPMCGNPNPQDHLYVNNPIHVDNESPYTDARTPKPGPCGRLRSKSTPTISPEIREQLRVSKMSTGNSTFIQQLENLVGGQQSKIPAIPRRHSQQPEADDDYEYLPF